MRKDTERRLKLEEYYRQNRRMPTYAEAAELFGLKSKDSAHHAISRLIQQGAVSKDATGKLIPAVQHDVPAYIPFSISNLIEDFPKVLGVVEAGFPSPAGHDIAESMSIDDFLVERSEATYLLQVKGDSMINAGIHSGDFVVVERGKSPRDRDIVIARIDGEYTMKYYRTRSGEMSYLEAANEDYAPMYPRESLEIEAVVVGVVRKYR